MTKANIRKLSSIKFVTVHHSASEPSLDMKTLKARAKSYNALHKAKPYALITGAEFGYDAISYHYLVSQNGIVLQVQDIKYERNHAGDRARGKNSHNIYGIAICIDSNTSLYKVSTSTKKAIAKLIYDLEGKLKKSLIVRTHREQAVHPTTGALPEKTGKIYTECAGNLMGTHKSGACKEIINMVNEMKTPSAPSNPCAEKAKLLSEELGKERTAHIQTKTTLDETTTLNQSLTNDLATMSDRAKKAEGLIPTLNGQINELEDVVRVKNSLIAELQDISFSKLLELLLKKMIQR